MKIESGATCTCSGNKDENEVHETRIDVFSSNQHQLTPHPTPPGNQNVITIVVRQNNVVLSKEGPKLQNPLGPGGRPSPHPYAAPFLSGLEGPHVQPLRGLSSLNNLCVSKAS